MPEVLLPVASSLVSSLAPIAAALLLAGLAAPARADAPATTPCLTARSTPGVLTIQVSAQPCAAGAGQAQLARSIKTAVAAMPRTGPSRSQLNAYKLQALSDLKAQSDYLGNSPAANYYGRR